MLEVSGKEQSDIELRRRQQRGCREAHGSNICVRNVRGCERHAVRHHQRGQKMCQRSCGTVGRSNTQPAAAGMHVTPAQRCVPTVLPQFIRTTLVWKASLGNTKSWIDCRREKMRKFYVECEFTKCTHTPKRSKIGKTGQAALQSVPGEPSACMSTASEAAESHMQ